MAYEDSGWNRASEWLLAECHHPRTTLNVLGVPLNFSVTPGSCDLAPEAIRQALFRFSTHSFHDFSDLRHIRVSTADDTVETEKIAAILETSKTILLGGDNGVTRLGVNALATAKSVSLDRIGVVTLDAHLDLRHLDDGPMNGNPIRGLIEDGLPGTNIVQIGLQSFANSPEYAQYGVAQGIRQVTAEQCWSSDFGLLFRTELDRMAEQCDHIYFDLDLDVMDRAFAPGCPGSRPGGLMPHHIRQAARIAGGHPRVWAMDIVELDPQIDINSTTALAAAACLLEFASGALSIA